MFRRMPTDTGKQMVQSGAWTRLGSKYYRHVSGVEVKWHSGAFGWEIVGKNEVYSVLWAARHAVERSVAV